MNFMKKKVTERGTEFIFNNKFSYNRVPKNDRQLNNFLKLKFSLISFFHIQKWFAKKPWFRLMERHWKKIEEKPEEVAHPRIRKPIMLTENDLLLEELVVYDLLPKEYLSDYHKKYLKFKAAFAKDSMFNRQEKDVNESFINMENSRVVGSWYNLDAFAVKPETSLSDAFVSIGVQSIGLTESYYILKYTLRVTEKTQKALSEILSSNVYKEPQCICNGRWWQKKNLAGCYTYDMCDDAKVYALEDYILELKSIFWNELNKRLFSLFFDWKNIPPSIEIYSSKTLKDNEENIFAILSSRSKTDIEVNADKTVYFLPDQDSRNKVRLNNSKIVASADQFSGRDKDGLYSFLDVEEHICEHLAEYFVLDALVDVISKTIYSSQLLINKNVRSKTKFNSLLKTKLTVDKQLYFYKRLYKELIPYVKYKTTKNHNIVAYKKLFKNKFQTENPDSRFSYTFVEKYNGIFYVIKEKHTLIQSIYEHFEENSKLVESRYNYRIVKWTLIVGFLTLLATVLLANNSEIIKGLWDFLKGLFN